MSRLTVLPFLALAAMSAAAQTPAHWTAGENYFPIVPAQPTNLPPGKVLVTEVFSYACPACYQFYPVADRLRESLPANAELNFVPAGFNPAEDWPVFQRAYLTAQVLGIAAKHHDAMFNAVWKSGELAVEDTTTNRLKDPLPTIEDVAKFYQRVAGVDAARFVATANSFSIELKIKRADAYITACQVDSTPTIIVNGKYRLNVQSAGGYDQTIQLVKYLVARESR
ncbi:MAG TPA: thiol:disulfide interchange protein DsbA/DsbL [Steroidobacteraceae bacterium]|nr:thiol:disulfide interchange protein DsbA/DsbL [Steroidobacteraceae bacterium]